MIYESGGAAHLNRWWTVVAGTVGCALGAGVAVLYTFGVFAAAMAADFGWSRSVHANSLTIFLVASGAGSLLLGPLIDRFGVRVPCAMLVTIFGLSVTSLALVPASQPLLYGIFALIGLSSCAATAMPYAVAIRSLFDRERGLALGLVNFGSGIGSAVAPFFASALLRSFGWRGGYLGVGLAVAVPALGLLFLLRQPKRAQHDESPRSAGGSWWAQTLRPAFWLIAIPIGAVSVATFGVLGTMVPLLHDRGVAPTYVATIMSCAGISSWLARPVVGYCLDRFFGPYVTATTFISAVVGLILLVTTDGIAGVFGAVILIGFALGSEGDLVTFLVSRYFGPAVYSRVLGAVWVTWAWGGGIGTFAAGVSFKAFGSYTPALLAFAVLLAIGSIVVCRLGPYEYPPLDKESPLIGAARTEG